MEIRCKRIYDAAGETDGFRVLVDRLWPRGIRKEDAHVDLWCKGVAPSNELRKWFGHVPERFGQFAQLYEEELRANEELPELLKELRKHEVVTLLYSARDSDHNNAVVLAKVLEKM